MYEFFASRSGRQAKFLRISAALVFSAASPFAVAFPAMAAESPVASPLETLVARIALYPDDLVAIVLPASTNTLQVVQAARYLEKRKVDTKLPVDEEWDDSVKSLLNYPEVIQTMNSDLNWTDSLGQAVITDQLAVLDAIQSYRRKVNAVGNLKSDDKQVVVVEKEIITIAPADPQVIYVPQYNPSTVMVYGGYSTWGYYPFGYPVYYYPYAPGAAFAAGLIWGAAISHAWHGGHYITHYGGAGGIRVNNVNVNINNRNRTNIDRGGGTAWKPSSNPRPGKPQTRVGDRQGPANTNTALSGRPDTGSTLPRGTMGPVDTSSRPSTTYGPVDRSSRAGTGTGRDFGSGASNRGTTPRSLDSRDRLGAGSFPGNTGRGSGAFGGYGSGRATTRESGRGSLSRSRIRR